MILPFKGSYPTTRGFIKYDINMPKALWDPKYGPTHRGIDYALPVGTKLLAASSGKITLAGFSPDGAGNLVVIKSGNLLIKTFHMSEIAVSLGQQVEEGQVIGKSGQSGNATGPHLHLQVEEGLGNAVDPAKYLNVNEIEEVPMPNEGDVDNVYQVTDTRKAVQDEKKAYSNKDFRKIMYEQILPKFEQLKKEYNEVKRIADLRGDRLATIAKKIEVDNPDNIDELLAVISPPSDAEKKLSKIKEIVKE